MNFLQQSKVQSDEKTFEISLEIKNFEKFILPIRIIVVFGILLWATWGSNIIFGDEGLHAHSARWIAQNLEIPKFIPLYGADLYDLANTKYIGAHISVASFFYAFGFSEALLKFLLPLVAVMPSIVMYLFVK